MNLNNRVCSLQRCDFIYVCRYNVRVYMILLILIVFLFLRLILFTNITFQEAGAIHFSLRGILPRETDRERMYIQHNIEKETEHVDADKVKETEQVAYIMYVACIYIHTQREMFQRRNRTLGSSLTLMKEEKHMYFVDVLCNLCMQTHTLKRRNRAIHRLLFFICVYDICMYV